MEAHNKLRDKLLKGEQTIGTFHGLGSTAAIEQIGYNGMDYVIIDTEHGPFDVEATANYIHAANIAGTTPFVRVKDGERNSILKMLDVGAMGLIIPDIHTVEQVEDVIKYGKYYPLGRRGVAPTSGSQYWTQASAKSGFESFFKYSNEQQLLIPQCETIGALENIEEIVALEGVSGIFVGPVDLSTSLGKYGNIGDPEVSEAIQHILDVCKKAGKFSFIFASNIQAAKERLEQGFDSVTLTMDTLIFGSAVADAVKQLKE